jgi:cytochrome c553
MPMRPLFIAALALAALDVAHAAAPAPPARLGLCAACHGADGIATMAGAPNLAGQQLAYLREALRQYRDGRRDIAVMRAATGPLSDTELDGLAAYYSALPPRPKASP